MKLQWVHFSPRMRPGNWLFKNRDLAVDFWGRLRRRFDHRVLAAVLMSNHFHLILETAKPRELLLALTCEMRAFTRAHLPGRHLWEPVEKIELIRDVQKLETAIRYVHLNPCRAGVTNDPWLWEFSTIFEHTGRGVVPWIDRARLERAVGCDARTWAQRHENFIAIDPYVAPGVLDSIRDLPDLRQVPAHELERAIERATWVAPSSLSRRGPARDFLIRARMALAPEVPLTHWVRELRIAPTRARELRTQPPTSEELRGVAGAVRALRHWDQSGQRPGNDVDWNATDSAGGM